MIFLRIGVALALAVLLACAAVGCSQRAEPAPEAAGEKAYAIDPAQTAAVAKAKPASTVATSPKPAAGARRSILPGGSRLGVVGFTNPQNTDDLLADCNLEACMLLPPKTLLALDRQLGVQMRQAGVVPAIQPAALDRCKKLVQSQQGTTQRIAALNYWVEVGECSGASHLMVPQVLVYRDKDIAAEKPSSVTLDLFLLDVGRRTIARRAHFEETQQPLLNNLLDLGTFVKRGGRWISADELAAEGIKQTLSELGL